MHRIVSLLFLLARLALPAPPSVTKVEPPDWVVEPVGLTLRMLLTGSDLTGASVRAPFPTTGLSVSQTGTHLFFDLKLPPNFTPGSYPIHVTTASGAVDAPFSIVRALPPQGRFQGFSPDDVIYLIMPDRFANGDPSNDDPDISRGLYDRSNPRFYHGGDFAGIIQHLPYIKQLGATAIWMTPIYDNSNHLNQRERYNSHAITDYHGYGAVDFYGVEEHFGTLDGFRELVDKAHSLGLKIIQDEVANHTGPYHPWVKDPPTPTWYNGTESHHLNETWRTWTLIDPHATAEIQKSTLEGWFANILPDLNQDDPECARYLIQNTLWWIGRTGLDGIREDTLPYVPRTFWNRWTAAIRGHYPKVNVVGEVFDGDPGLVSFFQGGRKQFDGVDSGVDAVFDFPLHDAVRKFFTGTVPAADLAKVVAHDYLYRDTNHLVTFVDLHDISRFMNLPGSTIDALRNVFTFLLTMRGIPMIYYGDEIAMKGGDDPDNRRDFPGGWKSDLQNAFEPAGRTPEQQSLIEHLQRLGRIRKELEPLRRGAMVELLAETDQYAFARTTPQSAVVVVFNRSSEPVDLKIPLTGSHVPEGASLEDALGAAQPATAHEGKLDVRIPANTAAIYRTK
jgi:glycosidase